MRKLYPLLFMLLFSMTVMAQDNVNLCPDDKHPHAIDMGLPSGTYWTSTLRVYGEGRACAIDFYPDRWELGDGIRNNALTVRPIRP